MQAFDGSQYSTSFTSVEKSISPFPIQINTLTLLYSLTIKYPCFENVVYVVQTTSRYLDYFPYLNQPFP